MQSYLQQVTDIIGKKKPPCVDKKDVSSITDQVNLALNVILDGYNKGTFTYLDTQNMFLILKSGFDSMTTAASPNIYDVDIVNDQISAKINYILKICNSDDTVTVNIDRKSSSSSWLWIIGIGIGIIAFIFVVIVIAAVFLRR